MCKGFKVFPKGAGEFKATHKGPSTCEIMNKGNGMGCISAKARQWRDIFWQTQSLENEKMRQNSGKIRWYLIFIQVWKTLMEAKYGSISKFKIKLWALWTCHIRNSINFVLISMHLALVSPWNYNNLQCFLYSFSFL